VARDEIAGRLSRLLDARGVQYAFAKRRGKHRSILIDHNGRTLRLFLPNSPSDRRSAANCAAMIKRALRGAQ
jgi:hypothetical protein